MEDNEKLQKYLISFLKNRIDDERKVFLDEVTPKIFPKSNKDLSIHTERAYRLTSSLE